MFCFFFVHILLCSALHIFIWMNMVNHIQTDGQCTFILMWNTRSVCHPVTGPLSSNRCIAKDPRNNHEFNLMPLSDYNHKVPYNRSAEFLINVCKPTLHGHNEMCPPNSAICMNNMAEVDVLKRFKNFGTAVPDPTFENGNLFMEFQSNEKCSHADKNITSVINFMCDERIQVIHIWKTIEILGVCVTGYWCVFDLWFSSMANQNIWVKKIANIALFGSLHLHATM